MRIIVTGADGFIARNLRFRLKETHPEAQIVAIGRTSSAADHDRALAEADWVFHLAGVNRPPDESEFERGNVDSTKARVRLLAASGRRASIVYASSSQAELDNPYGRSELAAEQEVQRHGRSHGARRCTLFRLNGRVRKMVSAQLQLRSCDLLPSDRARSAGVDSRSRRAAVARACR